MWEAAPWRRRERSGHHGGGTAGRALRTGRTREGRAGTRPGREGCVDPRPELSLSRTGVCWRLVRPVLGDLLHDSTLVSVWKFL